MARRLLPIRNPPLYEYVYMSMRRNTDRRARLRLVHATPTYLCTATRTTLNHWPAKYIVEVPCRNNHATSVAIGRLLYSKILRDGMRER